jgi:uncharacterized coiled-coil protein SlyX
MNTARMARRFHERGLEKGHADAIAEVLGEEVEAGLVTGPRLDARLAELEVRLLGRIGELDARLGGVERRLDHMDARLTGLEGRIGEVEIRLTDKMTSIVKWFAGIAIVQTAAIIGAVRLLFVS